MKKEIIKDNTQNNPYGFGIETNYLLYVGGINVGYISIIEIEDFEVYKNYLNIKNLYINNTYGIYISYIQIEKEYRGLQYGKYLLSNILDKYKDNKYFSLIIRDKRYGLNPDYTYNLINLYSKFGFIINNDIQINNHLYMEIKK